MEEYIRVYKEKKYFKETKNESEINQFLINKSKQSWLGATDSSYYNYLGINKYDNELQLLASINQFLNTLNNQNF